MDQISISSEYLAHESGTKFYEIVTIKLTHSGRSVLIRRWGKSTGTVIAGGGSTKIESFDSTVEVITALGRVSNDKSARGYKKAHSSHGFNGRGGIFDSEDVERILKQHYSNIADVESILHHLGIDTVKAYLNDDLERGEIVDEGYQPESVRSEDWGSWG